VTEPPNLPVPVKDLDVHELAALARKVAINISELPNVLAEFRITQEQYDRYLMVPFFKNALEAAIIDWNKPSSTERRLQLLAQAGLEDGMLVLAARMSDKEEALPAAVEVGKLFTKIAGIGDVGKQANPMDRFVITINLGDAEPLKFEKDRAPNAQIIDAYMIEQKEPTDDKA
jgi:hypothetical protein